FQAEDGIRDFHVTGVQTCALPICKRFEVADQFGAVAFGSLLSPCHQIVNEEMAAVVKIGPHRTPASATQPVLLQGEQSVTPGARSEERRVGKECRRRWETSARCKE